MADENPSDERIAECKEIFDTFDRDRDGTISVKEIGDVLRAMGGTPSTQEINELISNFGHDSGNIKFEAFLEIYDKKMKNIDSDEDLISAFKAFDKDSDGVIPCDELKLIMTTLGEKISPLKADEMLKEADFHGNGKINYYELIEYLTAKTDVVDDNNS